MGGICTDYSASPNLAKLGSDACVSIKRGNYTFNVITLGTFRGLVTYDDGVAVRLAANNAPQPIEGRPGVFNTTIYATADLNNPATVQIDVTQEQIDLIRSMQPNISLPPAEVGVCYNNGVNFQVQTLPGQWTAGGVQWLRSTYSNISDNVYFCVDGRTPGEVGLNTSSGQGLVVAQAMETIRSKCISVLGAGDQCDILKSTADRLAPKTTDPHDYYTEGLKLFIYGGTGAAILSALLMGIPKVITWSYRKLTGSPTNDQPKPPSGPGGGPGGRGPNDVSEAELKDLLRNGKNVHFNGNSVTVDGKIYDISRGVRLTSLLAEEGGSATVASDQTFARDTMMMSSPPDFGNPLELGALDDWGLKPETNQSFLKWVEVEGVRFGLPANLEALNGMTFNSADEFKRTAANASWSLPQLTPARAVNENHSTSSVEGGDFFEEAKTGEWKVTSNSDNNSTIISGPNTAVMKAPFDPYHDFLVDLGLTENSTIQETLVTLNNHRDFLFKHPQLWKDLTQLAKDPNFQMLGSIEEQTAATHRVLKARVDPASPDKNRHWYEILTDYSSDVEKSNRADTHRHAQAARIEEKVEAEKREDRERTERREFVP